MFFTTKKVLEEFDNQHDFERMCADILNAHPEYRDVVLVAPRGGSDGGRDITFRFGNEQKGLACVTLRKDIDNKFKEDFYQRQSGEYDKYYLFCNVYLTSRQKSKYEQHCNDKLQAEFVPQDIEALTSILDSRLENLRKKYLNISQSDECKALILDMASDNSNLIAREAVRKLRAQGWLQDGTLEGAYLSKAELQNVDLSDANLKEVDLSNANLQNANLANANLEGSNLRNINLEGAMLSGANLKNADLTEAILTNAQELSDDQLAKVRALVGATMVSGKRYNGRFNLEGDLSLWHPLMRIGIATFYGVSIKNYEWGQKWNRIVYQSSSMPMMYTPELEEWGRLKENPEGIDDNSPDSSYSPIWY